MTPAIAIFAFNRPDSLRRLLDSLSACPEFAGAVVTIFIDGPRHEAEAALVARTREVAETATPTALRIVASPENRGLKRSIYSGVSDVCARSGHAIVLEDDLVVSPAALTYFIEGLSRYADEPRVWSICGYTYESQKLTDSNRALFLPFAHPWGWATWSRAWAQFDIDSPSVSAEMLASRSFRSRFDVNGLSAASDLLDLARIGLIDSWFVRWYEKIFRAGGLSLFPTRRYVTNLGVGSGGTHASGLNPYRYMLGTEPPGNCDLPEWPSDVGIDFVGLDAMVTSRDARVQILLAKLGKLKRLFKHAVQGAPKQ